MTSYNRLAGTSLERLAALSDGIFAVAMTLLVLDIHPPAHEVIRTDTALWNALIPLLPRMLMYLMSFMTLGIFWNGQQTQFNQLTGANRHLTWLQIAFLAAVCLMPFSTSLLAEFIRLRVALLLYWANMLMLGLILYATWRYARHAGLTRSDLSEDVQCAVERRILVAQGLYAAGAALCVISTYMSIGFIVLVQLIYALAPRFRARNEIAKGSH